MIHSGDCAAPMAGLAEEYGKNLEEILQELFGRLKRIGDRPETKRRRYRV